MKRFFIVIITALLALASCSKDNSTKSPEKIDGTFILHSFGGAAIAAPQDKRFPTLKFDDSSKKLSGFAGCNMINASYETNADKLKLSPVAATRKACFNDEYEPKILKALSEVNAYEINGNLLSLKQGGKTLLVLKKLNLD